MSAVKTNRGARKRGRRITDPEERAAFREQRRTEERERLEQAVAELASSEGWRRWVESRSRFHTYSLNNTILIALQRPDATAVASYRTWQSLGRQVRRGERGIRIFAPMTVKVRRECGEATRPGPSTPGTAAQYVAAGRERYGEGAQSTEQAETRLLFKSVSVFDIGQTDGEPLPELETSPIEGDEHADVLPKLESFAEGIGFQVEYRDLSDDPRGGWCAYGERLIVVDSSVAANGRVRVLTHELAHARGVSSKEYGRDVAEVIVESAAFIVARAIGLDTGGESVPYVASWADGDPAVIRKYAEKVDELARELETAAGVRS